MKPVRIERSDSPQSTTLRVEALDAEVFIRVTPKGRRLAVYICEGRSGRVAVEWTIRRRDGRWVQP